MPFLIDDHSSTPDEIRARAILHQAHHGLDFVVVDYIQRLSSPAHEKNRVQEVGKVSSALKSLALDLKVPVVAISSLSRNCEARHDKRPILSDLRESGDLEYDADLVLFIYRDEIYNAETEFPNIAEIEIAKHRMGPTGKVMLYFKKELTEFKSLEVHTTPLEDWVK